MKMIIPELLRDYKAEITILPYGAKNYGLQGRNPNRDRKVANQTHVGRKAIVKCLRGQERKEYMKHMKKIITLLLAAVMVLAMSSVAFAGDAATGKTITLTGGKAGHTYTLYQIFTGTVKDGELTNIQWGNGVKDAFKATKSTAAAYAKEIAEADDARATAQALVGEDPSAPTSLLNGTDKELTADGNVVFSNLAEGYYVIVDNITGEVAEEGDYYSALIVEVVEDVNGALKGSGTTSEKKVKTEEGTAQDSAIYAIGDDVPFQLKATTASNVAAYKKYHITFQDKQSAGLDAPTTFEITIPGTTEKITLAANATAAVSKEVTFGSGEDAVTVVVKAENATPDSGNTFAIKVSFENKVAGELLPAGLNSQDILVNYTSTLNDNAEFGSTGNPNTSYIKYSNNPESTDDHEEGKTPDDKVTVFTLTLKVDKTDEAGNALKGAGFTLYKVDGTTETAIGSEVKGADLTSFKWEGLKEGSYKLVETTVPTGYNKADDITFDVEGTYDQTADDPQLTALTVKNVTPTTASIGTNKDANKEATNANMSTTVINKSGATLPETGGIGTVIFYVLGSLLVVGCGIILVSRRRMNANK